MKLKHRKIVFLLLLAGVAGSSMAIYAQSDAGFFLKTFQVVVAQQIAAVVIFFCCFGQDVFRSR